VIIPAFNEAENVIGVVEESVAYLEGTGLRYEVVVVNDGSSDNTADAIEKLSAKYGACVKAVHHPQNRGMGAALRTGLEAASGDILTWIPSDGQFLLSDVMTALPLLETHDLAIATRTGVRQSWRIVITACFHFVVEVMFGFYPGDICGIFLITASDFAACKPESDNVFFTVELPIRANRAGLKMARFELALRNRRAGQSKVSNLRTYFHNLYEIGVVWWKSR